MIWLRHELWEYPDGPGYRLASKAETDRLTAAHPDGYLRHVFYAPNAAAAEAQYRALRSMGPYIVNGSDSETPFTRSQLDRQLADFPDDHRLARQPALTAPDNGHPPVAAVAPVEPAQAVDETAAAQSPVASPAAGPAPHATKAPDAEKTEAMPTPVVSDGLGPVSSIDSATPGWASRRQRRRRRRNPFLGFLKLLWLLFVIGAVIVGVGIVTGYLDGPSLLAQARALPAVIRDDSGVRTLLPDLAR